MLGVTQSEVARLLGYKSRVAFANSTAKHRLLEGMDELVRKALESDIRIKTKAP